MVKVYSDFTLNAKSIGRRIYFYTKFDSHLKSVLGFSLQSQYGQQAKFQSGKKDSGMPSVQHIKAYAQRGAELRKKRVSGDLS